MAKDDDIEQLRLLPHKVEDSSFDAEQHFDDGGTDGNPITTDVSDRSAQCSVLRQRIRRCDVSTKQVYSAVLLLVGTAALSIYFRMVSTLYTYLVFMLVLVPVHTGMALYDAYKANAKDNSSAISRLTTLWRRVRPNVVVTSGLFLWMWVLLESAQYTNGVVGIEHQHTQSNDAHSQGPIFIAVNLYNSAHLFPRFGNNILDLVALQGGPKSAYVSIYESNSNDNGNTLYALHQFENELRKHGIQSSVVIGGENQSSQRHLGVGDKPEKRIEFLSKVRNEAMSPLYNGTTGIDGKRFSKVLWLNDVFFEPKSILQLLQTESGTFDASCAFDYMPLGLYDTWVTRDTDGNRAKPLWPYFSNSADKAKLEKGSPILVNSCWNGAVAFDARWFTDTQPPMTVSQELNSTTSLGPNSTSLSLPLRFRTEQRCLSSECLLISLDMHRALAPKRPLIYMHPDVRVAYDWRTFFLYQTVMRWHLVRPWHLVWERAVSSWLFGWLTDVGRAKPKCQATFQTDWVGPSQGNDRQLRYEY